MLELGNALGFLLGPLLVPNPPSDVNKDLDTQNLDRQQMREDLMLLMYSRNEIFSTPEGILIGSRAHFRLWCCYGSLDLHSHLLSLAGNVFKNSFP